MREMRRKMVRRASPSGWFDRSAPVSAGTGLAVMEKLVDFRDFGDVTAGEGGRVAAGRLFRSGQVGSLGTTPFERLHALDLKLVVDLRFPDEAEHAPMAWPAGDGPRILQLEAGEIGRAHV